MGGWISLIGDQTEFDLRLERFNKLFSVEGVPSLRTKVYSEAPALSTVFWAWNKDGIPDLYFSKMNDVILIASGVITDLGKFGSLPPAEEETMNKILELWLTYGEKILTQINGSFSFLFHHEKMNQTFLFADRFASRSVWLGKDGNNLIIGNFPSAIAAFKREPLEFNPAGLWSFFSAGRQVGCRGLYANFQGLMAGQKAFISGDTRIAITTWIRKKYQPEWRILPSDWGQSLAEALNNSANRYKEVTKSPYLFLSGGLDSRIVAAAFRSPIRTLSLCTKPNAETRIAARVSKIIGLDHRIIVRSPYWYYDTIDASALISSGLYLNHHTHFIAPASNVASSDSKTGFLLGDLLENFSKHYFYFPQKSPLSFTPDNMVDIFFQYAPYRIKDLSRIGRHFNKEIREDLKEQYRASIKEYASSIWDVSEDYADRLDTFLRWANVGVTPTYNMITCLWPLAMERNISLDNEVHELLLKIPSALKGKGVLHRWILYRLNKKLLFVPDANTFLPLFVPNIAKNLAKRVRPWLGKFRRSRKQKRFGEPVLSTSGSWLLMHELYRKDGRYREQIETMIFDRNIFFPDLFDLEEIRKTWKAYLAGNIELHFEVEALRSFGSLIKLIPCDNIDL